MMQFRAFVMAAGLSALAAIAFSGHVEAHSFRRIHHHHRLIHHWHGHHWSHHYRRHWHRHHTARALPRNAYRYEARVAAESSDILATAERYLGDRNPTGFRRGPWCGAFMGMIARMTDHDIPRGFRRAISWIHAGRRVSRPRPGDVAVMRHHVTLFSGYGGRGFLGTGGNQGHHRVTVSSYPLSRVIAFVRLE